MEYLYAALPMRVVPSKSHDDLSKDQLLNDVTNTGVAAAVIIAGDVTAALIARQPPQRRV